jgi:chromate reductase
MPRPLQVLAVAGSLRRGSFNHALVEAAVDLAPDAMTIRPFALDAIPMFSEDVEAEGDPVAVQELKAAIDAADGLLIATPEYQHGVPGVLKNALDWASRPHAESVMRGKVAAIMGASTGQGGTARAQTQLRQALDFTGTYVVLEPEVLVADAADRFDDGRLVDDDACQFLTELLEQLAALIERLAVEPATAS